jgi:glycerate kinase
MADGGEGSIDVFKHINGYDYQTVRVKNPLGKNITTEYCIQKNTNTAMIEMAKASGLQMISKNQRNPMKTSSFGTGQLILDAINSGVKKIILFIGGSATNDIGVGMLDALGFKFYNYEDEIFSGQVNNIPKIVRIERPRIVKRLQEISFVVACDVSTQLLGPNGATYTYGKQKGANEEQLKKLENYLRHFSQVAKKMSSIDYSNSEGSGAAGGVGFSSMTFLNAKYQSGFELISELLDLENHIKLNSYDLIITGEGRIDGQTSKGKILMHLGNMGKEISIPVIAFGGTVDDSLKELKLKGITELVQISSPNESIEEAIRKTEFNLKKAICNKIQKYLN